MGFFSKQVDGMQQILGNVADKHGGKTGSNGVITNSATSQQPSIGTPNQYANTVGLEDNQKQISPMQGKGKGA